MAFSFRRFTVELAEATAQFAGVECRKEARKNVRVDTGDLRNSIRFEQVERGIYEVSANTEYAAAQEYGRPDLPRYGYTPYLRPAAKTTVDRLPELAKRAADVAARRAS